MHGSEPSGLFDFAIAAFEYVALRITVLCPILLCQMGSADGFSVSRAGEGSIGRTLLRHTSYCAFLMTLDLQFGLNLCKRFNFSGNFLNSLYFTCSNTRQEEVTVSKVSFAHWLLDSLLLLPSCSTKYSLALFI